MKMSVKVGAILLVVMACVATNGMSQGRRILVGGSKGWNPNTNYTDWAIQNGPFHTNDILVFKYPLPDGSAAAPDLYLMPDQWSFVFCNFTVSKLIGTPTEVSSPKGVEVQLNRREPYYFASSIANGYGCLEGRPKFVATPVN